MTMSWCIFFSSDWFISHHFVFYRGGMLKSVVLALLVTVIALSMIRLLDLIADDASTGEQADKAVRAIVGSMGFLVGFSWERAFDVGVMTISASFTQVDHAVTKLVLAIVLAALVIPAWRLHILPTIMAY